MPNSRSILRPIAPKPRELSQELSQELPRKPPPQKPPQELPQEPPRELPRELSRELPREPLQVIPFTPEIQEITAPNTLTSITITKVSKKNDRKASFAEDETGWDDENTGLLLSFLEENFASYRKNKSNFAKTAVAKIFPGKTWEQIKNKLARLVTKYNEIKEKENQTGREAQAKWKWFERIDALFGTRENHNPGFLVDGFSDDTQFFNSFKEKETKEGSAEETKDNQITKKRKSLSQDPLAEAIISMGNSRQMIWEKRLALESEQFGKRQEIEKEIQEAETAFKREELEVERIKAKTLQKKMEFDIEQSRMDYQLRMRELDLRMLQYKPSSE